MHHSTIDIIIVSTLLLGTILLFLLIILSSIKGLNRIFNFNGIPLCKIGIHKRYLRKGFTKISKYYCIHCRKPRKHPELEIVGTHRKTK